MFRSKNQKVEISIQSIYKGHFNVKYRGVSAVRCPFDYVIYQMIIHELKPDLVIEIGTNKGGGALYIADLMDLMGHGEVHTIDIVSDHEKVVEEHPRIKMFFNGCANYDLHLAAPFKNIIVIDDSSHTYENTLSALNKFGPIITMNSYFIVEDGIIEELGLEKDFGGGPLRAIEEFLADNSNFVIDRKWTDFFGRNATFNVNGYLKRIR
jgi:cephalosporin hydroxylase